MRRWLSLTTRALYCTRVMLTRSASCQASAPAPQLIVQYERLATLKPLALGGNGSDLTLSLLHACVADRKDGDLVGAHAIDQAVAPKYDGSQVGPARVTPRRSLIRKLGDQVRSLEEPLEDPLRCSGAILSNELEDLADLRSSTFRPPDLHPATLDRTISRSS